MEASVIIQAPAADAVSFEKHQQPTRRTPNFHPTIWGEHFLAYGSTNAKECISKEAAEHERLKQQVRKMLVETPHESCQKLDLIDAVQRLGVAYQFESEIEASLLAIYEAYDHHEQLKQMGDGNDELHTLSLRFRLLRQNGYYVSCDVFNKFKDPEGNFKESLLSNIRGMLSLYEAANYRVHDEDILEEALNFTTSNLKDLLTTQVRQALDMPIQKTLNRVGARQFISLYQEDESHNELLLNFAKLDFKILQKLHHEELSGITKWWKGLDCPKNMPFARDRVVECYMWILGLYFEPKYSGARKTMTKIISLASILDDIYDVHGTYDELVLLTDAIERWHVSALDQLPAYMRPCYQGFLDVYSEMEKGSSKEGEENPVNFAISSTKALARGYLEEAKWAQSGSLPSYEEYMKVALLTGAAEMLSINALASMGDVVSQSSFDWIAQNPPILRASSIICRLMDDIVSSEAEKERGELASAGECYANQYGVSVEEAYAEFEKQITYAWKESNKEWLLLLGPAPAVPKAVVERIVNFSRTINLLYRKEDCYSNSTTLAKDLINLVLVDPIEI